MPNNPLTDAALAELDIWLNIANQPYHARRKAAKAHAHRRVTELVPALRQRLTDAESRLAEAERERDAALEHAVSMQNDRDGAVYSMIINGCRIDDGALAARDARMKREGAAEWLEKLIAAKREERPWETFVPLQTLEQAAQRLREGK